MMKYALEIGFNIQKLEVKMWISIDEDWIALWLEEGVTFGHLEAKFIVRIGIGSEKDRNTEEEHFVDCSERSVTVDRDSIEGWTWKP